MSSPATSPLRPLRVGFIALTDAAPLIVASEQGFFARHGLQVTLSREVGWATMRDKIIYGELHAAHSLAGMLWSTHLGLGSVPCEVFTALVLNLHGNAITLSRTLWDAGVRDTAALRDEARRRRGERRMTFGVVYPFSSHHVMLRLWLREAGIDPDHDVRIVVVPPAQMFRNLVAGTIDGYCVGEPWNTLAAREGAGWCPATSPGLMPGHVEKVLMVRADFVRQHVAAHAALVAAVAAACAWCDEPANREELAQLLSRPEYLNLPAKVIAPTLLGRFDTGLGVVRDAPEFHVFHRGKANVPTSEKAARVQESLVESGLISPALVDAQLPRSLFREDLFCQALARYEAPATAAL